MIGRTEPIQWKADEEQLPNGVTVYRRTLFDSIEPEWEAEAPWHAYIEIKGVCTIEGQGRTKEEAWRKWRNGFSTS